MATARLLRLRDSRMNTSTRTSSTSCKTWEWSVCWIVHRNVVQPAGVTLHRQDRARPAAGEVGNPSDAGAPSLRSTHLAWVNADGVVVAPAAAPQQLLVRQVDGQGGARGHRHEQGHHGAVARAVRAETRSRGRVKLRMCTIAVVRSCSRVASAGLAGPAAGTLSMDRAAHFATAKPEQAKQEFLSIFFRSLAYLVWRTCAVVWPLRAACWYSPSAFLRSRTYAL